MKRITRRHPGRSALAIAGASVSALAIAALTNEFFAKRAEKKNRPAGAFIDVDGVRIHYIEEGKGSPLVLLHGNGSMVEDFISSGLIKVASSRYRVIAFDRPGFGHSTRSRGKIWNDVAQADLIQRALKKLGAEAATVLGHSWGCSVALALALNHPASVRKLVLASGYYYPSVRADVFAMSVPALPIIGDVVRYALSPLIGRVMWPMFLKKMFGPQHPPAKFAGFPKAMTFRPSQIRAAAEDSALMVPDAFARSFRYNELKIPVVIIAGEDDRIVDIDEQSKRLHLELSGSKFHRVEGSGHMVHQSATGRVMSAIDDLPQAA